MRKVSGALLAAVLALPVVANAASAQIAAVAIDRKLENIEGVTRPANNPAPDSVMLLDLSAMPPEILGEVDAPTSALGPPSTVAVSPDERLAVVTGGQRRDPETGALRPGDSVTVIDLTASPPRATQHLTAGLGAAGLSFTPDGKMLLVANRNAGTVSVFAVEGKTLRPMETLKVAEASSGVSHVAVTPDGRMALVTLDGDHGLAILDIDGSEVTVREGLLTTSLRPYGMDISPDGRLAAVGNLGRGAGDVDTVSIVDLTVDPVRVVNTVAVGVEPEAVAFSPDGKYLAAGLQNGSQMPQESYFHSDGGRLIVYAVKGTDLKKLDEVKIGRWSQGAMFTPDGRHILVESMIDRAVEIYAWDGERLRDTGTRIDLKGGGAAMARAR